MWPVPYTGLLMPHLELCPCPFLPCGESGPSHTLPRLHKLCQATTPGSCLGLIQHLPQGLSISLHHPSCQPWRSQASFLGAAGEQCANLLSSEFLQAPPWSAAIMPYSHTVV